MHTGTRMVYNSNIKETTIKLFYTSGFVSFAVYEEVVNYRKSKYLKPQVVSLVEMSIIHCPYLRAVFHTES